MTATSVQKSTFSELVEHGPITLHKLLSINEFTALAARHPDLQMEREANGKTIVMSPVKSGSGKRESILGYFIYQWKAQQGKGEVYSSSTGFQLPNGAIKSPDAAWVSEERLARAKGMVEEEFVRAVPDFVAEIRSFSDRTKALKKKMESTWMAHGTRLGWLIDPYAEKVWIYREGQEPEVVEGFDGRKLSGEDVLPGLEMPLDEFKAKKQ